MIVKDFSELSLVLDWEEDSLCCDVGDVVEEFLDFWRGTVELESDCERTGKRNKEETKGEKDFNGRELDRRLSKSFHSRS